MSEISYDDSSVESIFEHALLLTGNSLADLVELPPETLSKRSRGRLGNLVETYHFGIKQNSEQEPDFPKVGLELKVTGVVPASHRLPRLHQNGYQAKERLVLTMIDYDSLAKDTWESSKLLKKSGFILIMFYEYESAETDNRRKFPLEPLLFRIPSEDLPIIKRDWETIQAKVKAGKAHEISEGDTFYLGACRKGSGGPKEKLRTQPYSEIAVKSRAFCFKQSYISRIIYAHSLRQPLEENTKTFAAKTTGASSHASIEEATHSKFSQFLGWSVEELWSQLRIPHTGNNSKASHRLIANRILMSRFRPLLDLKKAGIELKTIRINSKGKPNEAMSFPRFKFDDVAKQTWEESNFFEHIERKFLFVIFKTDESGVERLHKVAYWNMPYEDRTEAERVWHETQKCLIDGRTKFPKASESTVAHVRPKGRNSQDTDITPHGVAITKQCFWLNKSYIESVIKNL